MNRVLLINPRITSHARFPLAVMHLAAALKGRYATRILDGNLDRHLPDTAAAAVREGGYTAVGLSVMGGPQLPAALAVIEVFLQRMAAYQLRPVDFSVLSLIVHNPGITSRQLCTALGILPPNLVALVGAIILLGIVNLVRRGSVR